VTYRNTAHVLCAYSVYYTRTLRSLRPPTRVMTLSNPPARDENFHCSNSQIRHAHAIHIFDSWKHGKLRCHPFDLKKKGRGGPWIITQISSPMFIRGYAVTCTGISKVVGTLAPQPILPIIMRIKLDYTIDYYSCNSTDKRFLLVVVCTLIFTILNTCAFLLICQCLAGNVMFF